MFLVYDFKGSIRNSSVENLKLHQQTRSDIFPSGFFLPDLCQGRIQNTFSLGAIDNACQQIAQVPILCTSVACLPVKTNVLQRYLGVGECPNSSKIFVFIDTFVNLLRGIFIFISKFKHVRSVLVVKAVTNPVSTGIIGLSHKLFLFIKFFCVLIKYN